MDQNQRDLLKKEFLTGSLRVLITDQPTGGIDVQQVSLFINYDLPHDRENYLRRIARGSRFGRKGVAISMVTTEDVHMLEDIKRASSLLLSLFVIFSFHRGSDCSVIIKRVLQHSDRRNASQRSASLFFYLALLTT
jgi:superfamily II DNA/RNA helicase